MQRDGSRLFIRFLSRLAFHRFLESLQRTNVTIRCCTMVAERGQIQFFIHKHLHKYKTYLKYKTYFFVRTIYDLPTVPLFRQHHFSHMCNTPLAILCTINCSSKQARIVGGSKKKRKTFRNIIFSKLSSLLSYYENLLT